MMTIGEKPKKWKNPYLKKQLFKMYFFLLNAWKFMGIDRFQQNKLVETFKQLYLYKNICLHV